MKPQKTLFLTLIIFSLLFSGCFSSWQEDTGTIILNLGSNGRYLDHFPPKEGEPDELEYEIIFTGTNDEFTLNSNGSQIVKTTVISGEWKITVKVYTYKRGVTTSPVKEIYAFGRETVIVKPGQYNPVTVKMSNEGEVEIKFVKLMSESGNELNVESTRFTINFFKTSGDNNIEEIKQGIGPHLIDLEKGTWNLYVETVYTNSVDDGEAEAEKFFINNDGINYIPNGYPFGINPGDRKILFITIILNK